MRERTRPPLSERHLPRPLAVVGRGAVDDPAVPASRARLAPSPSRRGRLKRRPLGRAPDGRLGRPVADSVGVQSEAVADTEPRTPPTSCIAE